MTDRNTEMDFFSVKKSIVDICTRNGWKIIYDSIDFFVIYVDYGRKSRSGEPFCRVRMPILLRLDSADGCPDPTCVCSLSFLFDQRLRQDLEATRWIRRELVPTTLHDEQPDFHDGGIYRTIRSRLLDGRRHDRRTDFEKIKSIARSSDAEHYELFIFVDKWIQENNCIESVFCERTISSEWKKLSLMFDRVRWHLDE